jgi:surface protein
MTVLRASNAPIGLDSGKPISTSAGPQAWIRPSDWVTYTEPTASEQKVVGTVAIWNQDSNYLAVSATLNDVTQFTVDWGDGTSTNHNSGTLAEKNYTWSSISAGTLTSVGYRQAIVTITPTTPGSIFNTVSLSRLPTGLASTVVTTSPWLEVSASLFPTGNIEFSTNSGNSTVNRLPARMLENLNLIQYNGSTQYLCVEMNSLQNFNMRTTNARINATNMFLNCTSLRIAPALPALNALNSMFSGCSSLQYVPLYNIADPVFAPTTVTNMFTGCRSLETVPLFNTTNIVQFDNMFSNCSSLKSIPNFNFSNAQRMASMFSACTSLESFPATNTGANLFDCNSMFNGCSSLKSVGLFNISGATASTSSMFNACTALETVPAFNLSQVQTATSMFAGCTSLQTVPNFNFSTNLFNFTNIFQNCRSLREIPEINLNGINTNAGNNMGVGNATVSSAATSLGRAKITNNKFSQSFQNCQMGATELNEMYTSLATLNPSITNISGNGTTVTVTVGTANIRSFLAGRSVTITGVDPVAYNISGTVASVNNGAGTFTITNAATGTYVSGGIASITSDRTITVTGNPGTAGDDPTIATNKGWLVTG